MKKISLILTSILLISALAACNSNSSTTNQPATTPTTENTGTGNPSATNPEATTPTEGSTSTDPASTESASAQNAKIVANKKVVASMYQDVLNGHQTDKIDMYLADDYKEHDPMIATGKEAFKTYIASFIKANPDYKVNVKGMIGQNDLVAVMNYPMANPDDPGQAAVDIFRVTDGKIVEHWNTVQPVTGASSMIQNLLPSASTSADVAATDKAVVASNAQFVSNFFNSFFVEHNTDAASGVVSESLVQHNVKMKDGIEPLVNNYLAQFRANPDSTATVVNMVAEGDLVLIQSQMKKNADDAGQSVVQIFRVENNEIAEMWMLSQDVPAKTVNENGMF